MNRRTNALWLVAVLLHAIVSPAQIGAAPAPNFSWETTAAGRSAALAVPATGKTGFQRMPSSETGIAFANRITRERYTTNQIYLNGSGVTAGDVDGDGWCDLFLAGLSGTSRLYHNEGNWKFTDVTSSAGVACAGWDVTGAALVDVDGDNDLDLLVNTVGSGTHLFLNDGKGHFSHQPVLNPRRCGASLALADLDGDGALDLYVANYRLETIRDEPDSRFRINQTGGRVVVLEYNGRPTTDPDLVGRFTTDSKAKIVENGEPDAIFHNDGQGRFSALSFTNGNFLDETGRPLREPPYDWGLSVMLRDFNGDGAPDIYVCNDFASPDRIWINLGHGKFQALAGTAWRHTSMFSMGVDVADVNRDGWDDLLVLDMLGRDHSGRHTRTGGVPPYESVSGRIDDRPQYACNTLALNRGDGTFAEVAYLAGLEGSDWSWTPIFLDVDLDGFEDLLITTGHERDAMNADVMEQAEVKKAQRKLSRWELLNLNNSFQRLDAPNMAFRNRGDLTFEDVSAAWGFDARGVSHGMCLADLDNDGDLDVVMNNLNEEAGLYRNEGVAPRLAVRLRGLPPNTAGIGARIRVRGGPVAQQSQEMICGGRYLSSDQALRVFAAGSGPGPLQIEVLWRSGRRSLITNAAPNRLYEMVEAQAQAAPSLAGPPSGSSNPSNEPALFEDVSHLLNHRHAEEPFDDLRRQLLLPWRLSELGPGLAWHDLDGDGHEDLIIGSGKGGLLAVYHNDGQGRLSRLTNGPLSRPLNRDLTGLVGLGHLIVAGSANYEDGLTNGGSLRLYDLQRGASGESLLGPQASSGPLALGDLDGDGDLDLFVGGRVIAGRYPEPALSQWLRNEGGRFVPGQRFEQLGLVSGAVLSDLDGDGDLDLVLACEWGPLRVLRNDRGHFEPWEQTVQWNGQPMNLSQLTGWWHGVSTGDLDGDGRMDLIASNWGKNSRYRASAQRPWRLHYGDLNGQGQVELVEGRWEASLEREAPQRGWRMVRAAYPFLQEHLNSFHAYGQAGLEEIYAERFKGLQVLEVNTAVTMLFLNRGPGQWEAHELPGPAQWTPAFGVNVADIDGDGHEDVFLSQNFFGLNPETGRQDAGRGLWLLGDGTGQLTPLSGQRSGIKVYGEQRGSAVADFDEDGRVDLVVSQNGAPTKLYRNVGGRVGLRVRLLGPADNPTGVGAMMRLVYPNGRGPAREVHAGSGYWSTDGAVQVLGKSAEPTALWVRWPGGKETTSPLPAGARDVTVQPDATIKTIK